MSQFETPFRTDDELLRNFSEEVAKNRRTFRIFTGHRPSFTYVNFYDAPIARLLCRATELTRDKLLKNSGKMPRHPQAGSCGTLGVQLLGSALDGLTDPLGPLFRSDRTFKKIQIQMSPVTFWNLIEHTCLNPWGE